MNARHARRVLRAIASAATMAALALTIGAPHLARADGCMRTDRRPWSGYCMGPRWGWYGAHDPVRSADEARVRLKRFFADEAVTVGRIVPRELYFEAEILDAEGRQVDRVIVDRRTGRIRSIL